jgi:hypothetical protein
MSRNSVLCPACQLRQGQSEIAFCPHRHTAVVRRAGNLPPLLIQGVSSLERVRHVTEQMRRTADERGVHRRSDARTGQSAHGC